MPTTGLNKLVQNSFWSSSSLFPLTENIIIKRHIPPKTQILLFVTKNTQTPNRLANPREMPISSQIVAANHTDQRNTWTTSVKHRSCIKDTNYFIEKVKFLTQIPESYFLFSMDVGDLYTNIDTHGHDKLCKTTQMRKDQMNTYWTCYTWI